MPREGGWAGAAEYAPETSAPTLEVGGLEGGSIVEPCRSKRGKGVGKGSGNTEVKHSRLNLGLAA